MQANDLALAFMPFGQTNLMISIFDRIEIAEQEISSFKAMYPNKAEIINNAFQVLCPTPLFREFGNEIYRSHVKILLQRVVNNEDLREPTEAECILVISNTSTLAPLTSDACVAMMKLWAKCPELKKLDWDVTEYRPSYKGAEEQIINEAKKIVNNSPDSRWNRLPKNFSLLQVSMGI